jgi:tetratricopeptide (TPR) repeat protein
VQALRDLIEFYLLAPGITGGDMRKAEATADRIAELDTPEAFLAKARIAEFRKQSEATGNFLRKASQSQPSSYRALIALAQFYRGHEHADPDAAAATAKKTIAIDAGRAEAYAILAEVYVDRGDWNALDAVLMDASRQSPDNLVPYYRAASQLLKVGRDPVRAERYLRVYLGQEPEGNEPTAAEAHWKLGLTLEAKGSQAEAVAEWKESVRLDPASPAARELKHLHPARTSPTAMQNERSPRRVQC